MRKRKNAIVRCGSDRELALIFNNDLRALYAKLSVGIPLALFRSIIHLQRPCDIQKVHPTVPFFDIIAYSELIRERNYGELPPTMIPVDTMRTSTVTFTAEKP
jgi:hypothetical protein